MQRSHHPLTLDVIGHLEMTFTCRRSYKKYVLSRKQPNPSRRVSLFKNHYEELVACCVQTKALDSSSFSNLVNIRMNSRLLPFIIKHVKNIFSSQISMIYNPQTTETNEIRSEFEKYGYQKKLFKRTENVNNILHIEIKYLILICEDAKQVVVSI